MSSPEDRPPSIGERYSSATGSSNLKLGERRCDVDMIIAAGLVPDTLAAMLYRLLVEFDGVRAEHAAAETRMRNKEREAEAQKGEGAAARAYAIRHGAEGEALLAHVLILSQLTSLRPAKEKFGEFAVVEATRQRFMRDDRAVMAIAGRVLDVFLNPTCRHCGGRGFNGGGHRGDPQVSCRPCRSSGSRRDEIGKDEVERKFAGHLLMKTNALMYEVQRDIRTGLNLVDQAKQKISEATS